MHALNENREKRMREQKVCILKKKKCERVRGEWNGVKKKGTSLLTREDIIISVSTSDTSFIKSPNYEYIC